MKIELIKNNQIYTYDLPKTIKDNFWITDFDSFDNVRNLINVVAENGKWVLYSNYETQIVSSERTYESIPLSLYSFYTIKNENEKSYYYIYCAPSIENKIFKYQIIGNGNISIGKTQNNNIIYGNMLVEDFHAQLSFSDGNWTIVDNKSRFGTFVNDRRIRGQQKLESGDVIFIAGLKIVVTQKMVLINSVNNNVAISSTILTLMNDVTPELDTTLSKAEELDRNLYDKDDYFYRSPRFIEDVYKEEINIEDPPSKINQDESPLILSIGPMFTMAITSFVTAFTTINNVINGETTWKKRHLHW